VLLLKGFDLVSGLQSYYEWQEKPGLFLPSPYGDLTKLKYDMEDNLLEGYISIMGWRLPASVRAMLHQSLYPAEFDDSNYLLSVVDGALDSLYMVFSSFSSLTPGAKALASVLNDPAIEADSYFLRFKVDGTSLTCDRIYYHFTSPAGIQVVKDHCQHKDSIDTIAAANPDLAGCIFVRKDTGDFLYTVQVVDPVP
jgi:hypothetical protein